jgi:hypothetical protein
MNADAKISVSFGRKNQRHLEEARSNLGPELTTPICHAGAGGSLQKLKKV